MRVAAFALVGALACGGCAAPRAEIHHTAGARPARVAQQSPEVAVASTNVEATAPEALPDRPVAFDEAWSGFGPARCSYLAPRDLRPDADGAVDVVFHFHAGQMSTPEMKSSGLAAVFVSCGYGVGTAGYTRAFDDPRRFGTMVSALMRSLGRRARRPVHLGRLALASWSAGFAAIAKILSNETWYRATDTVLLLDSLHARYRDDDGAATRAVDVRGLRPFVRFARDARAGRKTLVITHSAIVPPDYASTSEASAALAQEVGVEAGPADDEQRRFPFPSRTAVSHAMDLVVAADDHGMHLRGFRGMGPRDHFDHLHLLGDALRSWVLPRWYTPSE